MVSVPSEAVGSAPDATWPGIGAGVFAMVGFSLGCAGVLALLLRVFMTFVKEAAGPFRTNGLVLTSASFVNLEPTELSRAVSSYNWWMSSVAPASTPQAANSTRGPTAFADAFEDWLAARRAQLVIRQSSSVAVYRSMWDAFSTWCMAEQVALDGLTPGLIERFMAARMALGELSDRHAWRWLSLIDSVVHARTRSLDSGANRAAAELLADRPEWQFANAADRDPMPEHLSAAEARMLVVWLLTGSAGYSAAGAAAGSWQALRNRCAAALQLGAGLTPGDLRAVVTAGVVMGPGRSASDVPLKVRVPAHGAVAAREVPIAPWAAKLVSQWLARRSTEALPGVVLFPGTRKGLTWSKVPQYEAVNSVLTAAGVAGPGRSGFVLRHTFALRQLRRGHAPEDVARWLGVTDPGVMARYQRVEYDPPAPA